MIGVAPVVTRRVWIERRYGALYRGPKGGRRYVWRCGGTKPRLFAGVAWCGPVVLSDNARARAERWRGFGRDGRSGARVAAAPSPWLLPAFADAAARFLTEQRERLAAAARARGAPV